MSTVSVAQRVLTAGFVLLFISCSATRHPVVGPTGSRDLARYVLVVEKTQDGQVTHAWKPVGDFDLENFRYGLSAMRTPRGIVRVSTNRIAYCEGRRQQCESDCLASSRPIAVGHLRYPTYRGPWRINKGWWCEQSCTKLGEMCTRGMGEWAEEYAAEFNAIEPAVDWIKNHREEILVGTVIVISGVAFAAAVAASAGGALILVPVVLLVEDSSGSAPAGRIVSASP